MSQLNVERSKMVTDVSGNVSVSPSFKQSKKSTSSWRLDRYVTSKRRKWYGPIPYLVGHYAIDEQSLELQNFILLLLLVVVVVAVVVLV